ncbi:hypothetical protein O3Q51_06665 [Cryomorphaceae bacterium 1068]|nr:hypothetical protein [Cryomorphaceae bacterium 1068]
MKRIGLNEHWIRIATLLTTVLMFPSAELIAQEEALYGTVSFITSQNVYLRFDNTDLLQLNDTIYQNVGGKNQPCLVLKQKSSVSCIAEPISDCKFEKGDKVVYFYTPSVKKDDKEEIEQASDFVKDSLAVDTNSVKVNAPPKKVLTDHIDGRISLANNTTAGNGDLNSRTLGRLALDAENIGGSKFSFYSYSRFRYNKIERNGLRSNDSRMSIYELALQYDADSSLTVSIGRQINNRMLSVGAMDGLNAEKRFRNSYVGAVVGSRTDPRTYGVNPDLFQYGAYVGLYHDKKKISSTTFGVIDQRNTGATDRRYVFAQHRNRIGDNINLFATAEMDIYKTDVIGNEESGVRPTSFYVMANYRVSRKLRITASYDMRRNRILYASYSESLNRLITNDPYRNGYRLRVNYNLSRSIYTGAGFSQRTQSDNHNTFTSINVFLSFARIPIIGGRWSNVFTTNQNTYYTYNSFSTRYTRDFFKGKLSVSPNARLVSYNYINFDGAAFNQTYLSLDLDYDIAKNLSIGADYEYSQRGDFIYHRFNTNLIKRF